MSEHFTVLIPFAIPILASRDMELEYVLDWSRMIAGERKSGHYFFDRDELLEASDGTIMHRRRNNIITRIALPHRGRLQNLQIRKLIEARADVV